jgi:hypothetical protein
MADEIIPISRYREREVHEEQPPRAIALWGLDGDRSRLALPLWRIVHLAGAERGVILSQRTEGDRMSWPFAVVDLGHDPARLDLGGVPSDAFDSSEAPLLRDLGDSGVLVNLGTRDGRAWCLFAEGGQGRAPLDTKKREDILFLAGECAGLLFLRDFANEADDV